METVVVGVNGSACDTAAVDFAVHEARLRGARLRVVAAWKMPQIIEPEFCYPSEAFEGLHQRAQRIVRAAIAGARELEPTVPCEGEIREGQFGDILVKEARDAALLVVGNPRRGWFASFVLGSVSRQAVNQALCPVVVVRQDRNTFNDREGGRVEVKAASPGRDDLPIREAIA